ncbi:hypothetical protein GH714_042445 [Hevea brasiliensis]|uniref:Uncharacterized protein n=1 Tax=Hevea brasiliensis TaxID=3981 RepID=A0A6A6M826_HEVBR|nr:hypothetical protein GH714_042445 [Hevea brasiliensis]
MAVPSHSESTDLTSPPPSKITDLNEDSLSFCATYLSLQDLSNLAMTCKFLKRVAYSDSIWQRCFSERWPQEVARISSKSSSGARDAYLARHASLHQFKFVDPLSADLYTDAKSFDHIMLDKNDYLFTVKIDSFLNGKDSVATLSDNARITSMRLFPIYETSLFRSESQRKENVLVTSSCDHSIRLWWKGSCHRCFRGHNGPVSTLSDKLLGDSSAKLLASGGEDGTVRLWSLSSSGKRGQHGLKATFYGHEKPIKLMSVAEHRASLLVTISKDSKVRVWDTTTSSAIRSSCCVGMTTLPGTPVDMKCHESLLYFAAGSSVGAVDLRTMQKVITAAIYQPKLYSFAIAPSKSLVCTGGNGKALLWDIRRNQETLKPEPLAELDGHTGPVTQLHMDPYKIVTGGPEDLYINVWEAETGMQTNSFICCQSEDVGHSSRCTAMAVKGTQIVTTTYGEESGIVRFRDFFNASCPVLKHEDEHSSKFWDPQCYSDSNTDSSDI